ncbi:MAG: aminotransferase class V-fold PLP-dependent enzyme [Nocardioidaceae bacterium]|nr:aminotransferase class V-fold PLP-dependent enzyme [Nocardioidaceae bacterium]NUS51090.1 aminotransferase class V-fold PLP-dependent enzyme [Nocardioidaceae bacterium]
MLTPAAFRRRFPALQDTVHLASCSQGALSDTLSAALVELQHTMRQDGAPWGRWMAEVDTARRLFADLIGADEDEVAVVPTASAGAFQVASTQDWAARPTLVTTDLEFPSVAHVWLAQRPRGADVRFVDEREGVASPEEYVAAVDETCGLVSVPLVSYRNGVRLPVREVIARSREVGAPVFVDAYQGLGVEPVVVHELGCDYLVAGALKYLLGLPGIAFLYVRRGLVDPVPPSATGWFGQADPFAFDPRRIDVPTHARRFESGTPAIPSAFGAVAGLTVLREAPAAEVRDHVAGLTARLHEQLVDDGEKPWSPADPALRGPQVAIRDDRPDALAAHLAERRIVTSPRGDLLRLSLHYYNDTDDVDAVVRAIHEYRKAAR